MKIYSILKVPEIITIKLEGMFGNSLSQLIVRVEVNTSTNSQQLQLTTIKECEMYNGEAHEQVVWQFWDRTVPHFEISNLLEILQQVHFLRKLIVEKK